MLEVEDAQSQILSVVETLPAERVSLPQARGRILRDPIASPLDLPRADLSAMDGYAVRAAATRGATPARPVKLKCLGSIPAGRPPSFTVGGADCVRIFTGSWLPEGADAVVMQEDTRAGSEWIEILDAVKPFENLRLRGEDVKQGRTVLSAGERLASGPIALLGALGLAELNVSRPPRVALLATGDELVEPGRDLQAGQIYESNRAMVAALVAQSGGCPQPFPIVPDSPEATRTALEHAFAECDAVITSGGVSVGEHDYVKAAFEAMGGRLEFWKVSMKPGKPFVFGRFGHKLLFGLPGNPVSAFVTFLLLVRPALLQMQGAHTVTLPAHPATLAEPVRNRGDRRHYVRAKVDASGQVRGAGLQASHALASLAAANALLTVPPDTDWPAGTPVTVLRWEL